MGFNLHVLQNLLLARNYSAFEAGRNQLHFRSHQVVLPAPQVLAELGMQPAHPALLPQPLPGHLPVMLDGRPLGTVAAAVAPQVAARLRALTAARLALTDPVAAAAAAAARGAPLRLQVDTPPSLGCSDPD